MAILRHIRIPSIAPHFPPYALAVELQSHLQKRLLEYKASVALLGPSALKPPAPPPTLISFTPAPTYTLGRRQNGPLSAAEHDRLRAPLTVQYTSPGTNKPQRRNYEPDVVNAPRGGLATYHGPGQVVFWPVIDLHSQYHRQFTVHKYACLLEKTTIAALARVTKDGLGGGIEGFTTTNPGVWVKHVPAGIRNTYPMTTGSYAEERKIAALGVHLRRHVTALGVAVNVNMPVVGPEETNPWSRIVACGLEDKSVTNIVAELYGNKGSDAEPYSQARETLQNQLSLAWADEFEERLGAQVQSTRYEDPDTEAMILAIEQRARESSAGHGLDAGHCI
ncbi:hypothetical protein SCUP515_01712 [Seiridium cupressi]